MRVFAIILFLFVCCQFVQSQEINTSTVSKVKERSKIKDPKKALLYSIIPSGGQIYNEKWWEVPIVVGGMFGLYKVLEFYQRFVTLYGDELDYRNVHGEPLNPDISFASNSTIYQVFKQAKRYRDYAIVYILVGYLVQSIWAYVDARLSKFDISDDLTFQMNILPNQEILARGGGRFSSKSSSFIPVITLKIKL